MSDLEPVRQEFEADLAPYVDPMREAADEAKRFADDNAEAAAAVDRMQEAADLAGVSVEDYDAKMRQMAAIAEEARARLDGASAEIDRMGRDSEEASAGVESLRDKMTEAAFSAEEMGREMRSAGLKADEAGIAAAGGMDEYRNKIAETLALVEGATAQITILDSVLDDNADSARKAAREMRKLGIDSAAAAAAETAAAGAGAAAGGGGFLSRLGPGGTGIQGLIADPGGGLWFSAGLAAAVPVAGALVTELSALAGGFTAAGLGAGSFAAFAIPAFDKIKTAYTGVTTAQANYRAAQLLEEKDPTKANLAAEALAADKLKVAWANMTPETRKAVHEVMDLRTQFDGLAKALQPDMMRIFNNGLKDAKPLLNDVGALAGAAVGPIDGLVKDVGKFAVSPGFKAWLTEIQKLEGPAITAIGKGIGDVVTNLGKFVTALPPADIIRGINIAFRVLSGTVHGLTDMVQHARKDWDGLSGAFDYARHQLAIDNPAFGKDIADIARYWDDLYRDTFRVWHAITGAVSDGMHSTGNAIRSALSRVEADWDSGWSRVEAFTHGIPGKILSEFGDIGGLLVHDGAALISGLISGIESEIPGLSGIVSRVKGLLADIGIGGGGGGGGGGGSHGGGGTATGPGSGPQPGNSAIRIAAGAVAGGGAINVQHQVTVNLANVMAGPAAQQALARHVQAAVLDFAGTNAASMLVLPGRAG